MYGVPVLHELYNYCEEKLLCYRQIRCLEIEKKPLADPNHNTHNNNNNNNPYTTFTFCVHFNFQ